MENLDTQIENLWTELNKEDGAKLDILGTTKELLPNKDEVIYCRIVLIFKNRSGSFKITDKDDIGEKLREFMKAVGIRYEDT